MPPSLPDEQTDTTATTTVTTTIAPPPKQPHPYNQKTEIKTESQSQAENITLTSQSTSNHMPKRTTPDPQCKRGSPPSNTYHNRDLHQTTNARTNKNKTKKHRQTQAHKLTGINKHIDKERKKTSQLCKKGKTTDGMHLEIICSTHHCVRCCCQHE